MHRAIVKSVPSSQLQGRFETRGSSSLGRQYTTASGEGKCSHPLLLQDRWTGCRQYHQAHPGRT